MLSETGGRGEKKKERERRRRRNLIRKKKCSEAKNEMLIVSYMRASSTEEESRKKKGEKKEDKEVVSGSFISLSLFLSFSVLHASGSTAFVVTFFSPLLSKNAVKHRTDLLYLFFFNRFFFFAVVILLLLFGKYSELIQAIRKLARKEEDLPFCFQLQLIFSFFFFNAVISRCMCVCVCVCESVSLSRIMRRIHSNGLFLVSFSKDAHAHVLAFFPAATVKKKRRQALATSRTGKKKEEGIGSNLHL